MHDNDKDAVLFETANDGAGPDIIAEIDGDSFTQIIAARRAAAAADEALTEAVSRARVKG